MSISFPRLLATTSEKKRKEWTAIAESLSLNVQFEVTPKKHDLVELQSLDPVKVCITKAWDAWRKLGRRSALVEDAYYKIKALGGFPGPLYVHTEKTVTNAGLCKLMEDKQDRTVFGGVTIGFASEDGSKIYVVVAEIEGEMPFKPEGPGEFGWDNIFRLLGRADTFASMSADEKNAVSMRRKGIEMLSRGEWQVYPATDSPLTI